MNSAVTIGVLIVGFSAGLRAFTPAAVVAWCAYLGHLNLDASTFSFMSSPIAVGIFSVLAIGEYVGDLLPSTPNRTAIPGLVARLVIGSFVAACLLAASGGSLYFAVLGAAAAVVGAYAGLEFRTRSVRALKTSDAFIAIPEDLIAIMLSIAAVWIAS